MDYMYTAFFLAWLIILVPTFHWILKIPGISLLALGFCGTSILMLAFKVKIPTLEKGVSKPEIEINLETEPELDNGLPPMILFKVNKKRETMKGDDRGPKLVQVLDQLVSPGFALIDVAEGPSISQFRVRIPDAATDTPQKITNKLDALKMKMRTESCGVRLDPRNQAVMVEIPALHPYPVLVSDILKYKANHPLDVALGKTASGKSYIINLSETPHLLIAGQTGGGKSVLINTILAGLLTHRRPDELNLYLIDPKMVELKIYERLPHLKAPIATNPESAINLLAFIDQEMRRRYDAFAQNNVRDLQEYRKKGHLEFPYIVVIFDEVGDMINTNKDDIEPLIISLGQMARAAGICMILATQRPSVDVITGVIKANIPSRIALRTASAVDSKVILDEGGAEQLLGKGDMWVKMGGTMDRVQGSFISTDETEKLVKWWADNAS